MTTTKYDFPNLDISTQGWDVIITSLIEQLDADIHTRIYGTGGETAAQYSAMYLKSDGKYWKAQADGSKQPCMGLAIESVSAAVAFRLQRIGPITNAGWSWANVGKPVYLDPSTPGALTQTDPITNRNIIGIALSATSIFIMLDNQSQPWGDYQPVFNATQTIDWKNGTTQELTLTGSITSISFSNWINGRSYRLILIQGGAGSYTVSGGDWASVKWMGGGAPTLTTTVAHADCITFVYGNSIIYGAATLNFY
jgi:hypothetical protein